MMQTQIYKFGRFIRNFSTKTSTKLLDTDRLCNLIEHHKYNILFSSFAARKLGYGKKRALQLKLEKKNRKALLNNSVKPFPIALKFLNPEEFQPENKLENDTNDDSKSQEVYLPYTKVSKEITQYETSISQENEDKIDDIDKPINEQSDEENLYKKIGHNWMTDYKTYEHDLEEDEFVHNKNYGVPDPNYKRMGPPCCGCGALLNCVSTGMPGYLPSELYKGKNLDDLKDVNCQRCHFLKNYNIALNVSVEPNYYNSLISSLKDKYGLIVLLVDLLDFPGCIWPGLPDLIGKNRPVFVVGNKVDLIPKDSKGYLQRIEQCLLEAVINIGIDRKYIKYLTLVSASTGYGIENLITILHREWGTKGDVYIVGCTNVGKSTIFNALLGSDFCKYQALDLIQRATASPWPGTTLNMLRFPILRPSGARMYIRNERLKKERREQIAENELRILQMQQDNVYKPVTLMGHIGQTFRIKLAQEEVKDIFSSNLSATPKENIGFNEKAPEFRESRWCYDTPGVMHDNQILDLLTTDEILMTLPKETIRFRNFCVSPGTSLLLGGLGRIDYLEGEHSVRMSVYASESLPILICKTVAVDEIYNDFLGTSVLGVPIGTGKRLAQWPGLKACNDSLNVIGQHGSKAVADILLSSAGWVSLTPFPEKKASFRYYTLAGRGGFIRMPPLILYGSSVRGDRISKSPAYKMVQHHSKKHGLLL